MYRGLSYLGLAFLSLVPKITSLFVIFKFLGPSQVFLAIGLGSLLVGSFGGLNQSEIRTLFSFSSLGHFGLIFILVSIGHNCYSLSLFYLILYCLTTSSLLFILSILNKKNIIELGGFVSYSTALGPIIGVLFLSLLGFPPLSGFICKLVVIASSVSQSTDILVLISVVLTLVISAFYYLRAFNIFSNNTESFYQGYSSVSEKVQTTSFCYPFLIVLPVFITISLF